MQVPEHIFRAYDVRGLVEEDLTEDLVTALGRAYATWLIRTTGEHAATVALGRDVRPSSDELRNRLVQGLVTAGATVYDVGVVPTPVLYYAQMHHDATGGVMITGSHNPPEYNGFKLGAGPLPLSEDEIQAVKRLIVEEDYETGEGAVEDRPTTEAYCDMVADKVELERPVKVVLDPANATGALFASELLERIGAEVVRLYDEVDGTFPNHHPDPTVDRYVVDLMERVVETDAELGVGLDGDCDRIGAVDEEGRLIRGDQLTAIFAREQLARTPGARILFDVKSSRALEQDVEAHGGVPVMWKTGHSLAKKKMHEDAIPFGGEMSGHLFFFDDYFGFDDAIYAAAKLCEIVSRSEESLGEMIDSLTSYASTPEVRVDTTEEKKWEVVEAAADHFGSQYPTTDIDGVRVTYPAGWALMRPSNTQPVIVLRAEGETEADLEAIKAEIDAFLADHGVSAGPWGA